LKKLRFFSCGEGFFKEIQFSWWVQNLPKKEANRIILRTINLMRGGDLKIYGLEFRKLIKSLKIPNSTI